MNVRLQLLRARIRELQQQAEALGCTTHISLHTNALPDELKGAEPAPMILSCYGGGRHGAHYSVVVAPGVHCIVAHDATPEDMATLPHPHANECESAGARFAFSGSECGSRST